MKHLILSSILLFCVHVDKYYDKTTLFILIISTSPATWVSGITSDTKISADLPTFPI